MILLVAVMAALSVYITAHLAVRPKGGRPEARKARRPKHVDRQMWLQQAGAAVTPRQFWVVSAVLGAATFVLLLAIDGSIIVALVPAAGAAATPTMYWSSQRSKRLAARQAEWPEAIRHVLGSIESGRLSLHMALAELARTGPEALRPPFSRYARLAARLGEQRALETVRNEMGDAISDRVFLTFEVAVDKGTELVVKILRDLADQATGDKELAEKIRTAQLNIRIGAWATLILPYVALMLVSLQGSGIRDFYSTAAGLAVVAVGTVWNFTGMIIIQRLGKPIVEERVFAAPAATDPTAMSL